MGGIGALGFISLGAGFLNSKIPLIVLRALGGIGNYPFLSVDPCRTPFLYDLHHNINTLNLLDLLTQKLSSWFDDHPICLGTHCRYVPSTTGTIARDLPLRRLWRCWKWSVPSAFFFRLFTYRAFMNSRWSDHWWCLHSIRDLALGFLVCNHRRGAHLFLLHLPHPGTTEIDRATDAESQAS